MNLTAITSPEIDRWNLEPMKSCLWCTFASCSQSISQTTRFLSDSRGHVDTWAAPQPDVKKHTHFLVLKTIEKVQPQRVGRMINFSMNNSSSLPSIALSHEVHTRMEFHDLIDITYDIMAPASAIDRVFRKELLAAFCQENQGRYEVKQLTR